MLVSLMGSVGLFKSECRSVDVRWCWRLSWVRLALVVDGELFRLSVVVLDLLRWMVLLVRRWYTLVARVWFAIVAVDSRWFVVGLHVIRWWFTCGSWLVRARCCWFAMVRCWLAGVSLLVSC